MSKESVWSGQREGGRIGKASARFASDGRLLGAALLSDVTFPLVDPDTTTPSASPGSQID